MRLHISPNLALGFAELKFLQSSLDMRGLLSLLVQRYGIIQTDQQFTSCRVVQGNGPMLTIGGGVAIDRNLNIIRLPSQVNRFTVPEDGVTRFVTLRYKETAIERGLVTVQSDGLVSRVPPGIVFEQELGLTPEPTAFTDRFRGVGAFPSKIRFPQSTVNTGEYFVKTVLDDDNLVLNVSQGALTLEDNVPYEVVGSYSPGVLVGDTDKFPFRTDDYELEFVEVPPPADGLAFRLASVTYEAGDMSITDLRQDFTFKLNPFIQ